MARIRTIKPELPHSESLGRVSRDARLCFILLWTLADDSGRLRGNSRMLASLLFPYDDDAPHQIDGWLIDLSAQGCIDRYIVDGSAYVQVTNWTIHQKIDKPSASKLPHPEDGSRILSNPRELSSEDQGPRTKDQGEDQGPKDQDAPRKASPNGSRLPADWELPDDWKAWALQERPDLAPESTAARFSDYWHGVAGAKGRKADWQATWRNWVRNEKTKPSSGNRPSRMNEVDRIEWDRLETEKAKQLLFNGGPPDDFVDFEMTEVGYDKE